MRQTLAFVLGVCLLGLVSAGIESCYKSDEPGYDCTIPRTIRERVDRKCIIRIWGTTFQYDCPYYRLKTIQIKTRCPCPRIDGGWTAYSNFTKWSTCSVTCRNGIQTRTRDRTCTNPKPRHGGRECIGEKRDTDIQSCYEGPCPEDICIEVHNGHKAHPKDCNKFLNCADGKVSIQSCPKGQAYIEEGMKGCTIPPAGYCGAECNPGDFAPHPDSCSMFLQCKNGKMEDRFCQDEKYWNQEKKSCDLKDNVQCGGEVEDDTGNGSEAPFSCPHEDGNYPDEEDCTKFYQCSNGIQYHQPCSHGLGFNRRTKTCDWKSNIPGCN